MELGESIRQKREAKGISQEAVARMIGVSIVTFGKYERGEIDIPSSRIPGIAQAVDTTPEEIWAAVETKHPSPA